MALYSVKHREIFTKNDTLYKTWHITKRRSHQFTEILSGTFFVIVYI